jgi:ABC-type nitrate/sulfonate/bicarbonate transport system, permease component
MRNKKIRVYEYFPFIITCITLLIVIELSVNMGIIPSFIIPAPSKVTAELLENSYVFITKHMAVTLLETILGIILSLTVGISMAILMFWFNSIKKVIYPFILISQTIPTIALSPIFVLWFGYGLFSKVAMAFLISFFPIVVGLYDGLRSTDNAAIELFTTMGADKKRLLLHLQIQSALPSFFSGLKMAVIYAVVGATIGEWLGSSSGLGYYTKRMSGNLNASGVFAAIILLSFLGITLFSIVALIEKILLKNE